MKTIVFYGSPAKDSHTKHLLDETLSVLEGEVKIVAAESDEETIAPATEEASETVSAPEEDNE